MVGQAVADEAHRHRVAEDGEHRIDVGDPLRAQHERVRSRAGSRAPGLVEGRVDLPAGPRRHARNALELVARRREEPLGRAEVPDQRPLARRADARERVEDRLLRARVPARAVEAEREAVRLVPDPLEELEARPSPVRARPAPDLPGTNTSSARFASATTATRGRSYACIASSAARELALAAVDDDEVRHGREALVVAVGGRRRRGARTAGRRPRPSSRSRPVRRRCRIPNLR